MSTKNQNIEIVRKACITANPDILKLEFGCEVIFHSSGWGTGKWILIKYLYDSKWKIQKDGNEDLAYDYEFKEIIGRPIRLADVLLAIQAKHGLLDEDETVYETKVGSFLTRAGYDLLKDDLRQQSDECLLFLAELLK